jgi:RNA polymerase sigma-70 factor, ECF subfamily
MSAGPSAHRRLRTYTPIAVARDPALDPLVDMAYGELRRVAERYVRHERARSVQATELVHEAYLRLARDGLTPWKDQTHFVAIAAIAMRRLLVERARRRVAAKRGGVQVQVTLDEALLSAAPHHTVDIIALDRALARLATLDPRQVHVVELRYFGGLSIEETAAALDLSPATVKRYWTLAKAWLLRELEGPPP